MDTIYILGSGYSINNLSQEEIRRINESKARIALNKFIVFYEKSGILPNYVYFIDYHNKHAKEFIQKAINTVGSSNLKDDLTFVFNKNIKTRLYPSKNLFYYLQALNPLNYIHFKRPRLILDYQVNIDFIKRNKNFLETSPWANNFDEPLFHFRSSLTSALNYATIKFPACNIKLVGVDLNNKQYFYQKEIEATQENSNEKYRQLEVKENKHFTAIKYKGTSMLDSFPTILNHIKSRGFNLYSTNRDSLLVQDGILEYQAI